MQSRINGASAFSSQSIAVSVTESAGVLTITSDRYGSSSIAKATGGNGMTDLVGATPTRTDGVDVVGTIGGVTANGSGQTLTGSSGTNAEDLAIKIIGGTTGSRGFVSYARGIATLIDSYIDDLLADDAGLDAKEDILNVRLENITKERENLSRRMVSVEARLVAQFSALDSLVGQLRQTSDFLLQQLASLPGPIKPKSN